MKKAYQLSWVLFLSMLGSRVAMVEVSAETGHVMVVPSEIVWIEGPPSLPKGAKMAVLEGDPKKKGLFTMRLKLPANYKVPAHWHPVDEHVTVISGTFYMGLGDRLDPSKGMPLTAGGFAVMPPRTHHFAWTKREAVVQVHAMGPWQINYVNPQDDPRKKK